MSRRSGNKGKGKGKEKIQEIRTDHGGGGKKPVTTTSSCSCQCATLLGEAEKLPSFVPYATDGDKEKWVMPAIDEQKWALAEKYATVWPDTIDDRCWLYDTRQKLSRDEIRKLTEEELQQFGGETPTKVVRVGVALHHIISKEKLVSICEALCNGYSSSVHRKWFWHLCMQICGESITKSARDANLAVKLLWNLPINLEIGPQRRVGDPGTAFDGNTYDDEGRRELDGVSDLLQQLENRFNPEDDECWCEMADFLLKAWELTGHSTGMLLQPTMEQWARNDFAFTADGTPPTWQKKGLRHFPPPDEAVNRFLDARKGVTDQDRERMEALEDKQLAGAVAGKVVLETTLKTAFHLTATAGTIRHICRRHNYAFFVADEIKAINNFWPEPMTFAETQDAVGAMLPDIAKRTIEYCELDDPDNEEGWSGAELVSQPVNGGLAFFIVRITQKYSDDDDMSLILQAHLETVSPDGQYAHGYTASALRQVMEEVDAS